MTFTVGIAGITGKFSTLVLQNLLERPDVKIRGYCKDSSKLPPSTAKSNRIEVIQGNVNDVSTLRKFVAGCDVVVCGFLGDNDVMTQGQKHLVDACEAEGVPRYVASDYCFDYNQLEYGQHPAKDPMKTIKEYLESKQAVKGVHALIGVFMDTFWSSYFGVWDAKSETINYWGSGEDVWESTSYSNAAKFVAAVALDPAAVGIQKYFGDRQTTIQIAETYEKAYGRKPTLKRHGSLDDLYKQMRQLCEKDPQNIFSWIALYYQYYCLNGQTYLGEIQNKYGIEHETFEKYMRGHSPDKLGY